MIIYISMDIYGKNVFETCTSKIEILWELRNLIFNKSFSLIFNSKPSFPLKADILPIEMTSIRSTPPPHPDMIRCSFWPPPPPPRDHL
jgi:hypothetical protein